MILYTPLPHQLWIWKALNRAIWTTTICFFSIARVSPRYLLDPTANQLLIRSTVALHDSKKARVTVLECGHSVVVDAVHCPVNFSRCLLSVIWKYQAWARQHPSLLYLLLGLDVMLYTTPPIDIAASLISFISKKHLLNFGCRACILFLSPPMLSAAFFCLLYQFLSHM
jgi:hypothetical protein